VFLLWIVLFCTVVVPWMLSLWTILLFTVAWDTVHCEWIHCKLLYSSIVSAFTMDCTVWWEHVGGCSNRRQAPGWRRVHWGCGHLTFGCQAWALGRPRPLAAPSAVVTWRVVCPALGAWATSYVLGRLSAHKTLGLMPVWELLLLLLL